MIVVDTSALMAILLRESEAHLFAGILEVSAQRFMSSGNFLELGIVTERMRSKAGRTDAEKLVQDTRIEIIPFDVAQARLAADAYERFGRGNHPAGLNFGDCFSYSLAKSMNLPLLFKGNDFGLTDVMVYEARA